MRSTPSEAMGLMEQPEYMALLNGANDYHLTDCGLQPDCRFFSLSLHLSSIQTPTYPCLSQVSLLALR